MIGLFAELTTQDCGFFQSPCNILFEDRILTLLFSLSNLHPVFALRRALEHACACWLLNDLHLSSAWRDAHIVHRCTDKGEKRSVRGGDSCVY